MSWPRIERRYRGPLLAVGAAFLASRILYSGAGIVFDETTYLGYWQFIDPALLTDDLWRSLIHLHTQPPLLNLATGVVLRLFPTGHSIAFQILYLAIGVILACSLLSLAVAMRLPAWPSAALAAWFMASPATVLFENWLFYAYPLTAALTLAAVALHRFAGSRSLGWGLLFFSLLALMALTWTLFHLAWFGVTLAALLLVLPARRQTLLAAAIPAILVTGWYAKNYLQVGQFTGSSWTGMNLSRVSTFCLTTADRLRMIRQGELSEFGRYPPFRNPERYLLLLPGTPSTGVPLLDSIYTSLGDRNRHHLVYAAASRQYWRDALQVIRSRPDVYARCVSGAALLAFHSATDYERVLGNRAMIEAADLWWNRVFYGQWQKDVSFADQRPDSAAAHIGWWLVCAYLVAIAGSAVWLWSRRAAGWAPRAVLLAFMACNVCYVLVVSSLADIGENNRFRFTVDPLVAVLSVSLVWDRLSSRATFRRVIAGRSQMLNDPEFESSSGAS